MLAATDLELVRVAYVSEDHDAVLRALGERISPRILHAPARLDTVVRQIEEYFEGGRHSFDVPLDWRLSNGFRQIVLRHLPEIGYGHTASYAMVARLADRPRAVRAVGTACATNPLPVVVPCHRVVRSAPPTGVPARRLHRGRMLAVLLAARSWRRPMPPSPMPPRPRSASA